LCNPSRSVKLKSNGLLLQTVDHAENARGSLRAKIITQKSFALNYILVGRFLLAMEQP
jgi:hypothetical protein